jgi:hypothetical protein
MALRKFGPNDIVLNTMRTYPHVEYLIYDGNVYYNNSPYHSGAFLSNILDVTGGAVSLYEYNIDRPTTDGLDPITGETRMVGPVVDRGKITPWIFKGSARSSFKSTAVFDAGTVFVNEFAHGDVLTGSYPLGGRIDREIMWVPGERKTEVDFSRFARSAEVWEEMKGAGATCVGCPTYEGAPVYPHFYALKNRLNYYGYMSEHYRVSSSYEDGWNKATDTLNLVSIPAIMYGSTIKKGTVSLRYYYTGSLLAELKDSKENGELIETIGADAGKVGGVVLYDEGLLVLTGSWRIPGTPSLFVGASGSTPGFTDFPRWIYFAAGAYDGNNASTNGDSFAHNMFGISFEGQTDVQVYTMFANARRGKANYSNNPTFLEFNQAAVQQSGSAIYAENPNRKIKNTVSSSYSGHSASFKKQVFISRVGIYDESKNLIGIATLADPVLKEEDQDYTFKIKLDI